MWATTASSWTSGRPSSPHEIAAFRDSVALPVEDKGLSLSYHYRGADDEDAARAELEQVAERAREEGLDPRWGRKVLEVRPSVAADKGTAVRALLASVPARRGLYAGDDTTDLDAFQGLAARRPRPRGPYRGRVGRGTPGARRRRRPDGPQPGGARAAPGDALGVWRRKAPGNTRFVRFRKGARLDPGQVRDVRGRQIGGAGGLAVGGGGIGIAILVIYLLVSALSGGGGGLPGQLGPLDNQRVGEDSAPSQVSQECKTGEDANQREDCRIVAVVNSVQKFWDEVFTQSNQQYQPADTVFFTDQVRHGLRNGELPGRPLLLPGRQARLHRPRLLRRAVAVRRRGHAVRGGLRARARVRPPRPGSPRRARPGPGRLAGAGERLRALGAAGRLLRRASGRRTRPRPASSSPSPSRTSTAASMPQRRSGTTGSRRRPRDR